MNIDKVDNGYIVMSSQNAFGATTKVFSSLDEVFKHALMHFEGRGESFGGSMYGRVVIEREKAGERP